ncbi:cell division topological specificity factor [Propionigenium maris DSM 9537]|uniref:Cell division topological specificity factor n=1 Tax=Propionigenium maris DSM 9537 TaxID=1123000 RepID=A0A9W6GNU1_9FUSO|nr:cell division topological specificity factor MinE [Propionigenium maris]GLI56967.1 cell division topological specificity factor [Propionigenium maris DSM 9537]
MSFLSLFKKESTSKDVAKDRLKVVLIHDRSNISPSVMEKIREDIIKSISKYVDIDVESLNLEMAEVEDNGRRTALVANIPIKR